MSQETPSKAEPPKVEAVVRSIVVWHCPLCDSDNWIKIGWVPNKATCANCDATAEIVRTLLTWE